MGGGSREPSRKSVSAIRLRSSRIYKVSLAGGTRTKGCRSGTAITARRPGALLTGLTTALAFGFRRRYHCPSPGAFVFDLLRGFASRARKGAPTRFWLHRKRSPKKVASQLR